MAILKPVTSEWHSVIQLGHHNDNFILDDLNSLNTISTMSVTMNRFYIAGINVGIPEHFIYIIYIVIFM